MIVYTYVQLVLSMLIMLVVGGVVYVVFVVDI